MFQNLVQKVTKKRILEGEIWWTANIDGYDFYENVDISSDVDYITKALKKIKKKNPELLQHTGAARKSKAQSSDTREKANELFRKKQWFEALKMYSKSIALAENESTELGFAYANRSALLLHRGYYKECLEDIDRALKLNYPPDKKPQLITRREKAEELVATQKKGFIREEIPPLPSKNQSLLGATEAIKLSQNDQYGRFIEATRDIAVGEILLIENPYVLVTSREYKTTHCGHCSTLCFNAIPCISCSVEMYCSEKCRDTAYNQYHQYECIIYKFYPAETFDLLSTAEKKEGSPAEEKEDTGCVSQTEIKQLALRITLKGFHGYQTPSQTPSTNDTEDRYEEVGKLQTHRNDLSKTALMVQAFNLAKQYHILMRHTNIMSKLQFQDKENILKYHMFRNRLIVCFNLAIIGYKPDAEGFNPSPGIGLYPTYSMFNHACYENVQFGFIGQTMIMRALRTIKKGEQCFVNYGSSFQCDPKKMRQTNIRTNFLFECKCKACVQNWTTYDERQRGLSPEHYDLHKPLYNLSKTTRLLIQSEKLLDEKTKENIIKQCRKFEKVIEVKKRPSVNYIVWHALMTRLFISRYQALDF